MSIEIELRSVRWGQGSVRRDSNFREGEIEVVRRHQVPIVSMESRSYNAIESHVSWKGTTRFERRMPLEMMMDEPSEPSEDVERLV